MDVLFKKTGWASNYGGKSRDVKLEDSKINGSLPSFFGHKQIGGTSNLATVGPSDS